MQPLLFQAQVREEFEVPVEFEFGKAGGKDLEHRHELARDRNLEIAEGQIGLRDKIPEFAKSLSDKISNASGAETCRHRCTAWCCWSCPGEE